MTGIFILALVSSTGGGLIRDRLFLQQGAPLAGLSPQGMILVGVVNAVGGSLFRDVLMRKEPKLFKPGSLLAIASLIGCLTFLLLTTRLRLNVTLAAWVTIGLVFGLRMLAVQLGWQTRPAIGFQPKEEDNR